MTKNYIKICGFVLLLITAAIYAEDKVAVTDPLKIIVVKQSNPTFSIILQSNPTTGYSWLLKSYDSNLITPIDHKFYPPKNKKLMGAPGYEKWTFKIKQNGFTVPQLTSITLVYLRLWEKQTAQGTNFKVVITNAD